MAFLANKFDQKRKVLFWVIQICVWSLYFLYNYNIVHKISYDKNPDQYFIALSYLILFSYFGIPLTLVLKAIIKRVLRIRKSLFFVLLTLVLSSLVLANIWFLEVVALDLLSELAGMKTFPTTLTTYFWEMFGAVLLLISWGAIYTFIHLYENWHEQQLKTSQAKLLAENANLNMLRYQLNPHFLFNSLGSLRALIREDRLRAEEMLNRITEFLRYTLVKKSDTLIPLEEELEVISNYLEIEKIRFGDKLQLTLLIDPNSKGFLVPSFLLHPIIENAVKYGMLTSKQSLLITLKSEIIDDNLYLEIMNTGDWYTGNQSKGTEKGIQNVKERLQLHFQDAHNLHIAKGNGYVKVKILIKT